MKRILTIIIFILTATVAVQAKSKYIKINSGTTEAFRTEMVFNVVFNDTNPIIDRKEQYAKDYYTAKSEEDYAKFVADVERAQKSFITFYNENKKDIKSSIDNNNTETPYTLKIEVTRMNVGNGGGIAIGSAKAGGAVLHGNMVLIDNSTQTAVCEMEFSKIKGLLSPTFHGRVISVYRYLADELIKAVKK